MKPDSSLLVGIDAALIALVSLAICLASGNLLFMTVFAPSVILLRVALVWLIGKEGLPLKAELLFLALCTLLGAFNDWNSVCNKGIYDYTAPHFFKFSTIPLWMLLFWGMILRFVARLCRWELLDPPDQVSDSVGIGPWHTDSGALKVVVELTLVLATRQAIYRLYMHPVLSWLPFLAALVLYPLLFGLRKHDVKLLAIFMAGGPLVEILYIQVGGLHTYHLGWLGGVPLWIALWWLVIVLIWKDISFRLERGLRIKTI